MGGKNLLRTVARLSLMEHVLELAYWLAAVVILIKLPGWVGGGAVGYAVAGVYVAAVIALYFFAARKLKSLFGIND